MRRGMEFQICEAEKQKARDRNEVTLQNEELMRRG